MRIISLANLTPELQRGAIRIDRVGETLTIYEPGDVLPSAAAVPDPDATVKVEFTKSRSESLRAEFARFKSSAAKDAADAAAAKQFVKLQNLVQLSPAQVQTWVGENVTNLAQAKDAIATLAVAVSVLARRL